MKDSTCCRWGTASGCCSYAWLRSTWSPVFEARMPQSGTYLHIIFPGGAIACLHINCLQEPDPGIILPVMSFTVISFLMVLITIYSIPNKWKMLQVFYTGGSKVSLHDAPTSSSPCVGSSLHCDVDPGFTFLSWFVEKDCAKLSGSVWTLHAARSGLIGNLQSWWGPGFQKISKFCKTCVKTYKKLSLE